MPDAVGKVISWLLTVAPLAGGTVFLVRWLWTLMNRIVLLEKAIESLKGGWRLELDSLKDDVEDHGRHFTETVTRIESRVETVRESSTDLASEAELGKWIASTQAEFQRLHRAVGRLEGEVMRLSRARDRDTPT